MTTIDELDRRLRDADPAAGLDADPDAPGAKRLLARARSDAGPAPTRSRRGRGRRLAVLVAALMIVSTGALATGVFEPNPEDVATILEQAEQAAEVHLPGWRPELIAETVWCSYRDGQSISTYVSEFPLDQPLTRDEIVGECTGGNDMARTLADPPPAATLCGATIAPELYAERVDERDERLLAGDLARAAPITPVVLGWKTICDQADVDVFPDVSLTTFTHEHLDDVNDAREVEISLRAIAMERCLLRDEAIELARQAAERLAGEWPLVGLPDRPFGPDCYQVWIDDWGLLRLEAR